MLIKNGLTVRNIAGEACAFTEGIYSLDYNGNTDEYFLMHQPDFVLPKKIYDEETIKADCDKWLTTFERAHKNIGISLVGLKGSGKSLTAQYLCQQAKKPVILITKPVNGTLDAFFALLAQPEFRGAIVFIDEFEKVFGKVNRYDSVEQDALAILPMMQLMDGNYATHFLFIVTSNESLHENFTNRLGRIRYRKEYASLPQAVVDGYLKDTLSPSRQVELPKISSLVDKLGFATYDFLHHYVDELNNSMSDPFTCLFDLNVVPVTQNYDIRLRKKDEDIWYDCMRRDYNLAFDEVNIEIDLSNFRCDEAKQLPKEITSFDHDIKLYDEQYNLSAAGGTIEWHNNGFDWIVEFSVSPIMGAFAKFANRERQ